jgi:dTDP-L-rhamnose 4-epimerase
LSKKILITGGAGFIGSHLADALLERGHFVRVLDNLSPQVHGPETKRPDYLSPDVELVIGDVRDPAAVRRSLKRIDAVYHFAAAVGVGQSMYEIAKYVGANNLGTAVLLEQLTANRVERLIVASSMSIYGEGAYRGSDGRVHLSIERHPADLRAGRWEARNGTSEILTPIPTPETKQPSLVSIYALSKYDQERMCLMVGGAYGIPTVALRFFNVYGTRQSLSNPYTGVLAIFASRYLNGHPPMIFEDGKQQRDFVSVRDVVQACRLALTAESAPGQVLNIGSGTSATIWSVARKLAGVLGTRQLKPLVTGKYRAGDVRHCFADISTAQRVLGYKPRVTLEEGIEEIAGWLQGRTAHDRVVEASAELVTRGLAV